MKSVVWNASGDGNRPTIKRMKILVKTHCPVLMVVLEHFVAMDRGEDIKERLGFDQFVAIDVELAKIWVFSMVSIQLEVLQVGSQLLLCLFLTVSLGVEFQLRWCMLVVRVVNGKDFGNTWGRYLRCELEFLGVWLVILILCYLLLKRRVVRSPVSYI